MRCGLISPVVSQSPGVSAKSIFWFALGWGVWLLCHAYEVRAQAPDSAETRREPIGQALGATVFRDQLKDPDAVGRELEADLHRLFLKPVARKYGQERKADLEPTQEECDALSARLLSAHESQLERERPALERRLEEIAARLSEQLDAEERGRLQREKDSIFQRTQPVPRGMIKHLLTRQKFEAHLFREYGGGRALWQQLGCEAYDAKRHWLEERERRGDFGITDPDLHTAFYAYWNRSSPFLVTDPDAARRAILESWPLAEENHRP